MRPFEYVEPGGLRGVNERLTEGPAASPLAGGMDLIGLMKDGIAAPDRLVSLKGSAGLDGILVDEGVRIGALTTLSEIGGNELIAARYTALGQAAASVGTLQIRNRGTLGGNLCQRPRCWYFRDEAYSCLKKGGDLCYAQEGDNRYHAIFANQPCAIVHPSSCAPALMVLDATVSLSGSGGTRTLAVEKMFALPDRDVTRETVLDDDEIITAIALPEADGWRSATEVIKARQSYDWPLAIACVALRRQGARVVAARVALGAVAPVPWRSAAAEAALIGTDGGAAAAEVAANAALAEATPLGGNGYKVHIARAALRRATLAASA